LKTVTLLALLSVLAIPAHADDADAAAGMAAVTDLGQLNGRALACGDKDASAKAKQLMLQHAPRTPRYGTAFEQATQQGFLSQVQGQTACPAAPAFAQDIEQLAAKLRASLPAGAAQ